MNLSHVTKFSPYFSLTLHCFYAKTSSFMPVLTIGIVLDSFYLLIFYSEKFSAWVWSLPFAVNMNLNLSIAVFCLQNLICLNYTKIQGARFERNYIVIRTWHINSMIAKNKPPAHHKTHLHTKKAFNTRPVSLFWSESLFFFSTTEVFTCSKVTK